MSFTITSFAFFAFLAAALLVYYLLPAKAQWGWLLVVSLVFVFLYGEPEGFVFLAADIAAVYLGTTLMERASKPGLRRLALLLTLAVVVGQLFLLKYYNGMRPWVNAAFTRLCGTRPFFHKVLWAAPVGVSYFSLSAIGYVLDVYWRTCPAQRNPAKVALLVAWFPALVSGPIVNYREQEAKVFAPRRFDYTQLKFGFERMLWGLFKKMVLADRAATFTRPLLNGTYEAEGFTLAVTLLMYAFQIYMDFSGCMDIVLGVSQMFGVSLPENFKRPFFSQNLSEFWRRWHITLGEWSKNYVLYPLLKSRLFAAIGAKSKRALGKKRGRNVPTYLGLIVLWLLIGVWHGGSATLIWAAGVLPALLLIGGQLLEPAFAWLTRTLRINTDCFSYRLFARVRTLALMCFIWLFASAASIPMGFDALGRLFSQNNIWVLFDGTLTGFDIDILEMNILVVGLLAVFVVGLLQERGHRLRAELEAQNLAFQWLVLLLGIFSIVIFGVYGPAYHPADFIYGGF